MLALVFVGGKSGSSTQGWIPAFAGITMALWRPHKGMKMAPLRHSGVGLSPRVGDGFPLSREPPMPVATGTPRDENGSALITPELTATAGDGFPPRIGVRGRLCAGTTEVGRFNLFSYQRQVGAWHGYFHGNHACRLLPGTPRDENGGGSLLWQYEGGFETRRYNVMPMLIFVPTTEMRDLGLTTILGLRRLAFRRRRIEPSQE